MQRQLHTTTQVNHKNVMLSEKIWTEKKKYKQYLCNLYDILSLMVERKPAVA